MTTISSIFAERGRGPYSKALKVRVVASDQPVKYRSKDGCEKSSLTCAVSDGHVAILAVCYDATKFAKFKIDTTLVLRDIIRRNEENKKTIVVTSVTKVFISAPIDVSGALVEAGIALITPPPTEKVSINKALQSPQKKRVSIIGKITQEDEPRSVSVRGEEIPIKTVTVEDVSGKTNVTLRRDTSLSPVRPGDHVLITDVVINTYQNKTTLSTTAKSTVEKCDAPEERMTIQVDAISVEGEHVDLFLDTEETLSVPCVMVRNALATDVLSAEEIDIEMAAADGPLRFDIIRSGSDVSDIKLRS